MQGAQGVNAAAAATAAAAPASAAYAASARGREKSEGKEAAGATLSPGWRGGSSGESEKPSLEESLPSDFC